MPGSLPPLKALHTFEVAARSLSFSRAADELFVTQGAVSKQIKLLEDFLGKALFERTASGLVLTEAGREYLPGVSESLENIRKVTARVQQTQQERNNLVFNLIPSFSSLWMIPHLAQMHQAIPSLNLTQIVGDGPYRFDENSADMAIRCLPLSRSRENAELLIEETLIPVIHPARLKRHPVASFDQLLDHPLLMHITRPQLWGNFLKSLELQSSRAPEYRHGLEHFYMLLEAARQQQGIALLPDFMVRETLERGELVSLLDIRYASGYGYYFMTPAFQAQPQLVSDFKGWLKEQLLAGL